MSSLKQAQLDTNQDYISIRDLITAAQVAGFDFGKGDPVSRLRYYTKLGLIPHPIRKQATKDQPYTTGYYPSETFQLLLQIQGLRKSGIRTVSVKNHLEKKELTDLSAQQPLLATNSGFLAPSSPFTQASNYLLAHEEVVSPKLADQFVELVRAEPSPQPKSRFKVPTYLASGVVATFVGIVLFSTVALVISGLTQTEPTSVSATLGGNTPFRQVLAAATEGILVQITSDASVAGRLDVDSLYIRGKQLTLGEDIFLDQQVSIGASPSFSTVNYQNSLGQITSGSFSLTIGSSGVILTDAGTQTITNKTISGSSNTFSNIPNSALSNSKITINTSGLLSGGGDVSLGSSIDLSVDEGVTVGTLSCVTSENGLVTGSGPCTDGEGSKWQLNAGVLSPNDLSQSVAIGGDSTASALIFLNGVSGNVGIGADPVEAKLTVQADSGSQGLFRIKDQLGNNIFYLGNTGASDGFYGGFVNPLGNDGVLFQLGGTLNSIVSVFPGGGGTDTVRLNSAGESWFNGGVFLLNSTSSNLMSSLLDVRGAQGENSVSGVLPVATISGNTSFATLIVDNEGTGDLFTASSSGLSRFVIKQSGNVGIGTTNPSAKLHLVGRANIIDSITGSNVFITGGNNTATGGFNTALGSLAGFSLTSGTDSTFVGWGAGVATTTGFNNSAYGVQAMWSNVSGFGNTSLGKATLFVNRTGNENVVVGDNAMRRNTTGSLNVAVGVRAIWDSISGNYNTALGSDTYPGIRPDAPSATAVAGAGLGVGTYYYRISYVVGSQETDASGATSVTTTSGNQQVNLSAIPVYSGGLTVTARKVYRTNLTDGGASSAPYYLVTTIADNSTTTYSDTTPDGSLGAVWAGPSASIALGYGAGYYFSNQMVIGSSGYYVNDIYLGSGLEAASPQNVTLNASGVIGTDGTGADFILAGGKGTGNGTGGSVIFKTSVVGSSGTTLQSLSEKMRISPSGNVGVGTSSPSSFLLQTAGSIGPNSDDTYDLGSNSLRWRDLYLGPASLHVGTAVGDEGLITYDTGTNNTSFSSTGNLILQGSGGNVGIGTSDPQFTLDVNGTVNFSGALTVGSCTGCGAGGPWTTTVNDISYSGGNVGIGTISPVSAFEISTASAAPVTSTLTYNNNPGTTAFSSFDFRAQDTINSSFVTAFDSASTYVNSITADTFHHVLYAGSGAGGQIYRCDQSLDCTNSANWTSLSSIGQPQVLAIVFDATNKILYAGTGQSGRIFRCDTNSVNCATNTDWVEVFNPSQSHVYALTLDTTHNVLYGGMDGADIIRCDITATNCDASGDWTTITGAMSGQGYTASLYYDAVNQVMYAGTGGSGRMFRCDTANSCDAAVDWTNVFGDGDAQVSSIVADTTHNVLYAGSYNDGFIHKCDNSTGCDTSGEWSLAYDSGGSYVFVGYDPINQILYAGTDATTSYSCSTVTDCTNSSNWTSFTTSDGLNSNFYADSYTDILYVGSANQGLIYYKDLAFSPTVLTYSQIQAFAQSSLQGAASGGIIFNSLVSGTNTEVMRISAGNVGIGSASPAKKLDVVGDARVSGNLTVGSCTGCASSQWTTLSSNIYFNTGNVGIGTTTPGSLLQLEGTSGVGAPGTAFLTLKNTSGQANNEFGINFINTGFAGTAKINSLLNAGGSTSQLNFYTGGSTPTNRLTIDGSGNVGIGTSTPTSFLLQTVGSIGPNTDDLYDLGSNTLRWRDLYLGPASLHVGTSTTDEGLITYDTTTNDTHISSTGDLVLQGSGGNVGIGIATPSAMLEIQPSAIGIPALQLRSANGQTSNLMTWVDSAGNVKGRIDSAGNLILTSQTSNSLNINQAIGGIDYSVFNASSSGTVSITQRNAELGTGTDGNCTVSSTVTIDTGTCVGRASADGVNFRVTSDIATGSATITVSSTPTGLAVGDEILIINLRDPNNAGSAYYSAADWTNAPLGKYEMRYITAINTNTLTLNAVTTNFYPAGTHNYDVVVQRVPQYNSVNVQNGGTLTTSAFSTSTHKGGVLFFRTTGSVAIAPSGLISASGKGFSGGASSANGGSGGVSYNGAGGTGGVNTSGAGVSGQGGGGGGGVSSAAGAAGANGGAGGGGGAITYSNFNTGAGGGGGYGTVGAGGNTAGSSGSGTSGGAGGTATASRGGGGGGGGTYGGTDLASMYLGAGGGAPGGSYNVIAGTTGGAGGGIVFFSAGTLTNNGRVSVNGSDGGSGGCCGMAGGGGGAGGSLFLKVSTMILGQSAVTSTGGAGGTPAGAQNTAGAGGVGRIRLDYTTASGVTAPAAGFTGSFPSTIPGTTLTVNRNDVFGKILALQSGGNNLLTFDSLGDLSLTSFETTQSAVSISNTLLSTGNLLNLNTTLTTGNLLSASVSGVTTGNLLSLNEAGVSSFSGNGVFLNFGQDQQNATSSGFIGNFLKFVNAATTSFVVDASGKISTLFGAPNNPGNQINGQGFTVAGQGKTAITDTTIALGNGADGSCSTSTTVTLDAVGAGTSSSSCVGRTIAADAVGFSLDTYIATSGAQFIKVATTSASPTGLAVGDEVLIINLRDPGNYDNAYYAAFDWANAHVGKYETHRITAIQSKTIFLDGPLTYSYDGVNFQVMVQRVPNYTSVTVSSGGTIQPSAFSATTGRGGVLFFRATGTVDVQFGGTLSATGKGYTGGTTSNNGGAGGLTFRGAGGVGGTTSGASGVAGFGGGGGGAMPSGSGISGGIGGGGGGGGSSIYSDFDSGAGGGGNYGGTGTGGGGGTGGGVSGSSSSGTSGGAGGNGAASAGGGGGGGGTYGQASLGTLLLGSGGGAGGGAYSIHPGASGGAGGGVIFISANAVTVTGTISSGGSAGGSVACCGVAGGGGGSGGAIYLKALTQSLGSSLVTTAGGSGSVGAGATGGVGGVGRIRLDGAISGTTSPTPGFTQPWSQYTDTPSLLVNKLNQGTIFGLQSNSAPVFSLDTSGSIVATGSGGLATLALNQTGTGDLFAASKSGLTKFVITNSGNVGVGTASARAALDVVFSSTATSAAIIQNTNSASGITGLTVQLDSATLDSTSHFLNFQDVGGRIIGSIQANGTTGVTYATSGIADFGEWMKAKDPNLPVGTIVCQGANGVEACEASSSAKVVGVVSDTTAFLGGKKTSGSVIVGFIGQVKIKISPDSGVIQSGDAIGIGEGGYGFKQNTSGYIVGKALEDQGISPDGTILAYLNPGYFVPQLGAMSVADLPAAPLDLSSIDIATFSGELKVLGKTELAKTSIGGELSVGLLHFDDIKAEISSLTGLVTIAGDLKVDKLILGASTGQITIPAGETRIVVEVGSAVLGSDSKIFVVPLEEPVALSSQGVEDGKFEIKIKESLASPLRVNWWIIN